MKRSIILFLIILLAKITSFSQTTLTSIENDSIVTITTEQLKITNLIFNEHRMLLEENELQHQQLHNYMRKTDILQERITALSEQRDIYKEVVDAQTIRINSLNKEITKKNRTIKGLTIGGVSVTVGLILFLIFK